MNLKNKSIYSLILFIKEIFTRMPFLTIITLFSPFISGILSFFVYSSQANLINIIAYKYFNQKLDNILLNIKEPILYFGGIFIIQAVVDGASNLLKLKMNNKINIKFKEDISNIASSINLEFFDDKIFCDKLDRAKAVVGNDIIQITSFITSSINIASSLVSIICLAATMGYYFIVIVIIVMIVLNLKLRLSTEIKVRKLGRKMTFTGRMADYLYNILMNVGSLSELKVYNSVKYFFGIWKKKIIKQYSVRYDARRYEIRIGIVVGLIQIISIFFILFTLLRLMNKSNEVTVGSVSVLFLALLSCGNKIMNLTWPLSKLYISSIKLFDLCEILKLKNLNNGGMPNYIKEKVKKECNSELVNFNNVSFKYKNCDKNVLKNVNIRINKNEKIAIIGKNGSGKTTLIKLLLELYVPTKGFISFKRFDENFSVVFQNFIKFELTLRENIALSNYKRINDDKYINHILDLCDLKKLCKELGGLDVPLGKTLKNGKNISGGQWQKIAIARSIFSDSKIIIFDEPTASLDPNAEVEIFNRLMKLCEHKTLICVSHRMGWAKNCDKVIVLNDGMVVEEGCHDDLLKKNGLYKEMYDLQSFWYL